MKRIGILTYHSVPNFGAQLQTLSTVGYFRKHGYDPVVLNWYPDDLRAFYLKRANKSQNELQYNFSQTQMPVSRLCTTLDELCVEIQRLNLDGLFLGSDALFDYTPECMRYNISFKKLKKIPIYITSNHRLPNPFWGSFNERLSRPIPFVGFSISSQNMPFTKLSKSEKEELGRLLDNFKELTVRDEWTRDMVQNLSNRRLVPITPDPVFAFNQNAEMTLSKEAVLKKFNLPQNYILISFLYPLLSDEYVDEIIKLIESKTGAECVSFPMPDALRKFSTKHVVELPLSPIDWYYLIKYSSGYIGERMHPIVVSLHNSVPFFCFDQYGAEVVVIPRLWKRFVPESSKVYDLLRKAGFADNMCFYSNASKLTPADVVERFLSFNKEKCSLFADKMQTDYNEAMDNLLTSLLS